MPRSSRHKSSKHREYSDSEKDFCLKEKKGRGDDGGSNTSSRQLKDSASTEKRKSDYKPVSVTDVTMKDLSGGGVLNIDYGEEYSASSSSSKKRKEKEDDDRWTGGDNNEHDLSKSDSKKSSRREESLVAGVDGEEGKRSGIKVESKHHRSERKERGEKEGGSERDRKGVKSERLNAGVTGNEIVGNEGNRKQGSGEDRGGKDGVGNTDYNMHEEFHNPDAERELDRRVRRRRDGSGDGEKRQEGVRELDGIRLSSKEDMIRSEKYKDEGHKEERTRDRYQEDVDKDIWHPDLKQRDNRATKEYTSGRSEEKHLKNEKKDLDVSQTKSKPLGSEYERESERDQDRDHERERGRNRDRDRSRHDRDRERDKEHDDREHDLERDRDRERDLERVHERERERELDRDRERGRDRDRERYHRERDRDRIRDRDHNHDRLRDREYDHEYGSHVDDKGSRYKDDRVRRSSPDVYDDYYSDKSRRVELEVDKERSLSRKSHVDSVVNSSRRRTSPNSRAYTDKYRDGIQDDTKFGDSSRDVPLSETVEKIPKYRSGEKRTKFEENHVGDLSERSPSAKASPAGLKDRSPSTSVDRRFQNRSGRRRSLDVDEVERKSSSSNDLRDISVNEDRLVRDFNSKKSTGEEYPPVESPFHHKSSQGNVSSHVAGPPGFRTGADSPSFMGSLGVDTRGHSGSRYRRSVDPNVGRMPGNAWKNAPNWPSPIPNGFLPFPPGPPGPHHGGFPPMLSQYPPLFGVRPSLDMNHPGMPYHMSEDRFSGHIRPIGWQSMVDGPVPHFHGWDANNSVLRDEHSMYGPGHLPNPSRRDINAEMWKPNGDANMDLAPLSQKDVHTVKGSMDDASSAQGASRANVDGVLEQASSHKMNTSSEPSSTKEIPMTPAKVTTEKTPESSSVDDTVQLVRAYLAKLDISIDLADPELYNQFINLAVKGQSELSEEVELEYIEEKVVADSEIVNLSMGLKYFPVAKESIFKKAMNLYKADSTRRSSFEMLNGETLHTPNALGHEAEQIFVQKEKTDSPVDRTVKKEESIPEVPETLSRTHMEGKEPVSLTIDGLYNGVPFQSADLALDPIDQGQTPALKLDEMDERKLAKEFLPAESAYVDALEPTTDVEIVGNDGKRGVVESAASDELLDVAVSGPLDLSHDSVKVCEALMSVSNESDSVILSRIHHAPESTH